MARQRLSEEVRRKQICEAAKKVFMKKGFPTTTMEEIIAESGMSKGGVYKYYKSTDSMLYDIMHYGNEYRLEKIIETLEKQKAIVSIDSIVEIILDKMLDNNEFMPLYAMFLQEMKRNKHFKNLFTKLRKESIKKVIELLGPDYESLLNDDFLIALINTFILSCEVLNVRKTFQENKKILAKMLKTYLLSKSGHFEK